MQLVFPLSLIVAVIGIVLALTGPDAVRDNLLTRIAQDWDGFSARADDYVVEGERVVSLDTYHGTYKRTGRFVTVPRRQPAFHQARGHSATRFAGAGDEKHPRRWQLPHPRGHR